MMVKILYETVDCTADPHIVDYQNRQKMLDDVLKVLESSLVYGVLSIRVNNIEDDVIYVSDSYSDWEEQGRKKAQGEYARKHKVEGLYFDKDAEELIEKYYPNAKSLPIGLTGYKYFYDLVKKRKVDIGNVSKIVIGVMWKFSMQHNCSDYITVAFDTMTVNYSSQDWYTILVRCLLLNEVC